MRIKKRGSGIFVKIVLVTFAFFLVNAGFVFYANQDTFSNGMTGLVVGDVVKGTFTNLNISQKIVLFVQVFVLVLIVFFILLVGIRGRGIKKELSRQEVSVGSKKYETDIDILHNILKRKKKIHLSSIARAFRVDKETAMDWCRTLESSRLGSIEYPVLGEPYIKL